MTSVHSFFYRCAENATGTEWSLITPTSGDLSSSSMMLSRIHSLLDMGQSFIDNFERCKHYR